MIKFGMLSLSIVVIYILVRIVYADKMDGQLIMKEKEIKISDAEGEKLGYTPKIDKEFVRIMHLKKYYTKSGLFSLNVKVDTIHNEVVMRDCGCN